MKITIGIKKNRKKGLTIYEKTQYGEKKWSEKNGRETLILKEVLKNLVDRGKKLTILQGVGKENIFRIS